MKKELLLIFIIFGLLSMFVLTACGPDGNNTSPTLTGIRIETPIDVCVLKPSTSIATQRINDEGSKEVIMYVGIPVQLRAIGIYSNNTEQDITDSVEWNADEGFGITINNGYVTSMAVFFGADGNPIGASAYIYAKVGNITDKIYVDIIASCNIPITDLWTLCSNTIPENVPTLCP